MAATVLQGISNVLWKVRQRGTLDLRWSQSELRSPAITHGPGGSSFSFFLSPVSEDTYCDLCAAQKYRIPVRLVSLNRPLSLVVVRLERIGEEAKITGWIAPYATRQ